jgi:hypothetical protein
MQCSSTTIADDLLSKIPFEVWYKWEFSVHPFTQIVHHILTFVDAATLLALAMVSQRWCMLSEDNRVWTAICRRARIHVSDGNTLVLILLKRSPYLVTSDRLDWSATRYARIYSTCPPKAVYMRHRCVDANWRRGRAPTDHSVHIGMNSNLIQV